MLRITINTIVIALLLSLSANMYGQKNDYSIKKIVIDPGHGGKDPGATVGKTYEKDIALDVSLRAGKMIKKMYPEVEIIYTRDKDIFIPLGDRPEIANKNKADLFISVHVNICGTPGTTGAETYILGQHRSQENLEVAKLENAVILREADYNTRYEGFDPNSSESYIMFELLQNEHLEHSRLFADRVQNHFVSHAKRKDRGVRQAGFLVLRKIAMPSVLIELGFMSNKDEKAFLEKDQGKQLLAEAIVKSFSEYKSRFDEQKEPPKPLVVQAIEKEKKEITEEPKVQPVETKDTKEVKETQQTTENKEQKGDSTQLSDDLSKIQGKWYGTQIMALKKKYNPKDAMFKKFEPVYYFNENGYYKYVLGLANNIDEATKQHQEIKKSFNGAFMVSFENGVRSVIE